MHALCHAYWILGRIRLSRGRPSRRLRTEHKDNGRGLPSQEPSQANTIRRPCSRSKGKRLYVEADRIDGTTRIIDTTGLEVEFLIGKKGAGLEASLKTNLGVTAQALRHLDILSKHPVVAQCLGHEVIVPVPEAYALHKMVINSQRGAKAHKDARAVANLQPYLNTTVFKSLYEQLTKKEKAQVRHFAEREEISL